MSSSEGKRERSLPVFKPYGRIFICKGVNKGKTTEPAGTQILQSGKQITVSENHPYSKQNHHYTSGGPFYTDKLEIINSPVNVVLENGGNSRELGYAGPVYCPLPTKLELEGIGRNEQWAKPRSTDTSNLDPLGATAISQCSPVNPVSNLGTGLTEGLKEGLPSLPGIQSWKRRTEKAKAASGEFLNAEFGWLPLVSEIKEVRDAAFMHSELMKQYKRDEGRNVRREFHFPIQSSSASFQSLGYAESGNVNSGRFGKEPVVKSVSLEVETRQWFVGAFTYGLPSQTDSWRRALGFGTEAGHLYGVQLSPDIVWELTPWSWAVDWFTNAGDVINNVTNFELAGQIMRYGYMMEESITTIHCSLKGTGLLEPHPIAGGPSVTSIHTSKTRRPANPFGFGLSSGSLSATQVLIAAAVGITLL